MSHSWNDRRMDEFGEQTNEKFREAQGDIRTTRDDLHEEIKEVKTELKDDIQEIRVEMNGRFAGVDRRFDVIFGALATALIGVLVHFLS
jgi:hypothetical protein